MRQRRLVVTLCPVLAALFFVVGCASRQQDAVTPSATKGRGAQQPADSQGARQKLDQMGIPYSEASFVAKAGLGDLQVVKLFLEAGIRPDARGEPEVPGNTWRPTALVKAAENGHAEVVRTLIAGGADLKAQETAGYTQGEFALREAVWENRVDVARLLLEAGLNPNLRSSSDSDCTLLMQAAGGRSSLHDGSPGVARALIDAGADVNAKTEWGGTAVAFAVEDLNPETVRVLIAAEANPNVRNKFGQTPLSVARQTYQAFITRPPDKAAAAQIVEALKAAGAK